MKALKLKFAIHARKNLGKGAEIDGTPYPGLHSDRRGEAVFRFLPDCFPDEAEEEKFRGGKEEDYHGSENDKEFALPEHGIAQKVR